MLVRYTISWNRAFQTFMPVTFPEPLALLNEWVKTDRWTRFELVKGKKKKDKTAVNKSQWVMTRDSVLEKIVFMEGRLAKSGWVYARNFRLKWWYCFWLRSTHIVVLEEISVMYLKKKSSLIYSPHQIILNLLELFTSLPFFYSGSPKSFC